MIDLLTEYATNERFSEFIMQSEEYKTAIKNEEEQYSIFDKTLTDEQRKLLDLFATANASTIALTQKIIYQQGLKDMFNLIMSLLDKREDIEI